jgi:hypothetical protein
MLRIDSYDQPAVDPADAHLILALRLLVARAAAPDSLGWWDDESLTEPAAFILGRTFPHSPPLAARSLALLAAEARHRDAAEFFPRALHLYDLDWRGADRLALRLFSPMEAPLDPQPIPSLDEFRRRLLALAGPPVDYTVARRSPNGGLVIRFASAPIHVNDWRHRAVALAWAYCAGEVGRPVIPLIIEH